MYTLPEDTRKFYMDHQEGFEMRMQLMWETVCAKMEVYNLSKSASKAVQQRFQKMKDIAWSYWIFPEEKDIMKLIDEAYGEHDQDLHQRNNAI